MIGEPPPAERYTKRAAKATGQGERTVQRDIKRGKELRAHLLRVIGTSLDKASELAEVAVPRALFAAILRRIDRLRGPPVPAT